MKIARLTSKSQIIKAFQALPYIVFKKKYLIPQKPARPTFNRLSLKENLIGSFRTKYPQMVTTEFLQKVKDPANHQKFIDLYLLKYEIENIEYYKQLLHYMQTYISPLKLISRGAKPDFLYYRENKEKVVAFMKEKNIRYTIPAIYEAYKLLPEAEKQIYQQKMQEDIQRKIKIQVQAQKKYEIPKTSVPLPNILYLQEVKDTVITRDMFGEFKLQPTYIQKIYRDKHKLLKEQKKNEKREFLNSFNLSEAEFQYIDDICEKVRVLRASIKKENKKLKESRINELEDLQITKQQQVVAKVKAPSVQMIKTKEIKTEEKMQEVKIDLPKPVREQFEFDDKPTQHKQEIVAEYDDENLDFDLLEEITIADIKKKTLDSLNKLTK